jgi:hypothetical protein
MIIYGKVILMGFREFKLILGVCSKLGIRVLALAERSFLPESLQEICVSNSCPHKILLEICSVRKTEKVLMWLHQDLYPGLHQEKK